MNLSEGADYAARDKSDKAKSRWDFPRPKDAKSPKQKQYTQREIQNQSSSESTDSLSVASFDGTWKSGVMKEMSLELHREEEEERSRQPNTKETRIQRARENIATSREKICLLQGIICDARMRIRQDKLLIDSDRKRIKEEEEKINEQEDLISKLDD